MIIGLVPLALAACGSSTSPPAAAAQTSMSPTASASGATASPSSLPALSAPPTVVLAEFTKYSPDTRAITYDPARVPVGSDVAVVSVQANGQTLTLLAVRGLPPNQHFGAHVHMNACGENPEAAGSHYQNRVDPTQPSVNPDYANPQNEIWLDFTTDAAGSAHVESNVGWTFGARPHKSIVIHAEHTSTEPGHAGTAGARLACVNV
ncbi:superoxide dismutase family protein [Pseudofrankia sp. EUN1h]|uniref:superoxide dismutase family protein n=2 Tax=Pseudofrankia TaxID=2994363 RepID=UPI000234B435|nr:superoxide dismutase family protein [Pseudofrankia sp. EUN1h]